MENKNAIAIVELVKDFIRFLDKETAVKVSRAVDLLEIFGADLKMPHCKKINKDIY